MLDTAFDLVWRIGHWSYLLIFVAATLECAAFVGLLVPGESLVVVAGVLAGAGVLELAPVIVVAAAGAAVGDSIGYGLGRQLGRPWLEAHGARFGLSARRLAQLDALFARHGGKAVLIGRFIGFLRALTPFIAGSSRMPYLRFLAYDTPGAVLWAVAFSTLGYAVGASWETVERWIGRTGAVLGIIAIVAVLLWLRRRHASDPRATGETLR